MTWPDSRVNRLDFGSKGVTTAKGSEVDYQGLRKCRDLNDAARVSVDTLTSAGAGEKNSQNHHPTAQNTRISGPVQQT
jgi:hypothetical protein